MFHTETMRMTFVEKKSVFRSSKMIIILLVLMCGVLDRVSGWKFAEDGHVPGANQKEGSKCQIKTGESGICRRLSLCGVYYEGLKQKTINYDFLVLCSFIDSEEVICCPLEETPSTSSSLPTTDRTSEGTSTTTEIFSIDLKSNQTNGTERPSQVACRNYSGANPAGLTFHILGGEAVELGAFPHMGGLIFPDDGGGADFDNRCGSSLISERYVLTAAHCIIDPVSQPVFVRFGVVVWNTDGDDDPPYDAEIENITVHPQYRSPLRYHDIALIRLRSAVPFTPVIRPACLYSDIRDIDSNTPLVIIGWGLTNIQTRTRSEVLLMANVTTVGLHECNATHIAHGVDRKYQQGLDEGQYCAFDPEFIRDSCQSDSGGPMQLIQDKESIIVGITSFGKSCGSTVPSVYVRVAYYLEWIESIVWPS